MDLIGACELTRTFFYFFIIIISLTVLLSYARKASFPPYGVEVQRICEQRGARATRHVCGADGTPVQCKCCCQYAPRCAAERVCVSVGYLDN